MPWASKMSDVAAITKTDENQWFFVVLEGWRLTLEAWSSSWLSCWLAGWQLAGLLTVLGAGLDFDCFFVDSFGDPRS